MRRYLPDIVTPTSIAAIWLYGISQIMLQENKWTGLLFLAGLFVGGWEFGIAAILSRGVGTITAVLFRFERSDIRKGIYGFSAALVGVALVFLFQSNVLLWIIIIFASATAAVLQHLFVRLKIPGYTFPFVFVTWMLVLALGNNSTLPRSEGDLSLLPVSYNYLYGSLHGFGQVLFQAGLVAGILFLAGLIISSPLSAVYAMTASLMGAFLSQIAGQQVDHVNLGLFGFNAILTAVALSGPKRIDAVWVFIGCVITICLNIAMIRSGRFVAVGGVFTFPFVAGTWITLVIRGIMRRFLQPKIYLQS